MAHFARISDGVVREVIVVHDNDAPDEATGQAFIASLGLEGEWVQTSYNGAIRGQFASIGDVYDPVADVFTTPAIAARQTYLADAYNRGKEEGIAEAMLTVQQPEVM